MEEHTPWHYTHCEWGIVAKITPFIAYHTLRCVFFLGDTWKYTVKHPRTTYEYVHFSHQSYLWCIQWLGAGTRCRLWQTGVPTLSCT